MTDVVTRLIAWLHPGGFTTGDLRKSVPEMIQFRNELKALLREEPTCTVVELKDHPGKPVSARCILSGCQDLNSVEAGGRLRGECLCERNSTNNPACPQHGEPDTKLNHAAHATKPASSIRIEMAHGDVRELEGGRLLALVAALEDVREEHRQCLRRPDMDNRCLRCQRLDVLLSAPVVSPPLQVLEYELANDGYESVRLCRMYQHDNSERWAIRRLGFTLNRDGEWEFEPQPSSRDDDYMQRNRYMTITEALHVWASAPRGGGDK